MIAVRHIRRVYETYSTPYIAKHTCEMLLSRALHYPVLRLGVPYAAGAVPLGAIPVTPADPVAVGTTDELDAWCQAGAHVGFH